MPTLSELRLELLARGSSLEKDISQEQAPLPPVRIEFSRAIVDTLEGHTYFPGLTEHGTGVSLGLPDEKETLVSPRIPECGNLVRLRDARTILENNPDKFRSDCLFDLKIQALLEALTFGRSDTELATAFIEFRRVLEEWRAGDIVKLNWIQEKYLNGILTVTEDECLKLKMESLSKKCLGVAREISRKKYQANGDATLDPLVNNIGQCSSLSNFAASLLSKRWFGGLNLEPVAFRYSLRHKQTVFSIDGGKFLLIDGNEVTETKFRKDDIPYSVFLYKKILQLARLVEKEDPTYEKNTDGWRDYLLGPYYAISKEQGDFYAKLCEPRGEDPDDILYKSKEVSGETLSVSSLAFLLASLPMTAYLASLPRRGVADGFYSLRVDENPLVGALSTLVGHLFPTTSNGFSFGGARFHSLARAINVVLIAVASLLLWNKCTESENYSPLSENHPPLSEGTATSCAEVDPRLTDNWQRILSAPLMVKGDVDICVVDNQGFCTVLLKDKNLSTLPETDAYISQRTVCYDVSGNIIIHEFPQDEKGWIPTVYRAPFDASLHKSFIESEYRSLKKKREIENSNGDPVQIRNEYVFSDFYFDDIKWLNWDNFRAQDLEVRAKFSPEELQRMDSRSIVYLSLSGDGEIVKVYELNKHLQQPK